MLSSPKGKSSTGYLHGNFVTPASTIHNKHNYRGHTCDLKEGLSTMPKLPLRIEIVRSHFKHISSMSEVSANDIAATLAKHYSEVIVTHVDTVDHLKALVARQPDLVFAGIYHVTNEETGEKIWLADELEKNAIRYTGSGKYANRLSLNKHLAKQRMVESGINTAAFTLARLEDAGEVNVEKLSFPLFVKPNNKSGGQGVDEFSVVHTNEALQAKVRSIQAISETDALIEEYLSGREFSVGIIGDENGFIAMPLELIAEKDSNGDRIRSRAVKVSDAEDMRVITNLSERLNIGNFAVSAFQALGGRGYGRIDIRLDAFGVPYFLEANHIPSLIKSDSSFLRAYEATTGKEYESMIMHIVRLALERSPMKNTAARVTFVSHD